MSESITESVAIVDGELVPVLAATGERDAPLPTTPLSARAREAIASRRPAELTTDEQLALAAETQQRTLRVVADANKMRDQLFALVNQTAKTLMGLQEAQRALDTTTSSIAAGLQVTGDEAWVLLREDRREGDPHAPVAVVGIYATRAGAERAAANWRPGEWKERRPSNALRRPGEMERYEADAAGSEGRFSARLTLERQAVTR